MKLDPTESINNMGTLRVDVLDAADLPSADRNGYSDPYCKFRMDGKEVFKTKVQKKTLHPAWNEFFEVPIKSRIGADFRCDVYDWDFGDKADYLGGVPVNLEMLDPFQAQEVTLTLDGKSGAIRLKLLFKPTYVMRSRQGSSTFSGTFATPGKIVGAPVKGVGFVGGNVIKGASFLKHGIMSKIRGDDSSSDEEKEQKDVPSAILVDGETPPESTPKSELHHSRTRSGVSHYGDRLSIGGKGESGTASISVLSATGYPPNANVRVLVRAVGPKGAKEVLKSKVIKSGGGPVHYESSNETCRVHNTTADAQYQIRVVDHSTFGSDSVLGEAIFFVGDQGSVAGQEKSVNVGSGTVQIRSSFTMSDGGLRPGTAYSTTGDNSSEVTDSPDSRKPRRSFLSKRSVSGA
jgi:Ca2+-dependent lipid-binding protein